MMQVYKSTLPTYKPKSIKLILIKLVSVHILRNIIPN